MVEENNRQNLLRDCRNAGKTGDYAKVIESADCFLSSAEKERKANQQIASVFGYKGFALLKQENYAEALSCLEESQRLRQSNQNNASNERLEREADVVEQSLKTCYQMLGKSPPLPTIIKYPRTTHLFDSGGTATTVDDLVLPNLNAVLHTFCNGTNTVVIEEKVDGANLGISLCSYSNEILVQNRSHYISQGDHKQFSQIPQWIAQHRDALMGILEGGDKILYGEWLTARHSIPYKKLPSYFVAFDIFDKTAGQFLSRRAFHRKLIGTSIPVVPVIQSRTFGPYQGQKAGQHFREELVRLLETRSVFRNDGGSVEGVVLRVDDSTSTWMDQKFKVVRPDFVQGCEGGHWSTSHVVEKQQVDFEFAEEYMQSCYPFA